MATKQTSMRAGDDALDAIASGLYRSDLAVRGRPWLTLAVTTLGGAMAGLSGTAEMIASPYIARSVHASLVGLQWIANAYLVTLALVLLPAGRIADRYGRRLAFVIGVVVFAFSSVGVAFSTSAGEMIAFRVVQGIGGALLQPASLALLCTAFPKDRLGLPLGIWGGVNALAIGLGPVIAGAEIQAFSWRSVFLVNLPLGVICAVLAPVAVRESRSPGGNLLRSLRKLMTNGAVGVGALLTAIGAFGLFGLLFMLTLYLQNVHGLDPVTAGAWMLLPTCVVLVSAPIGGILAERVGARWPLFGGLALMAGGFYGLSRLTPDAGYGDLTPSAVLVGIGTGLSAIAVTQVIMGNSPDSLAGMASALREVATQIGGIIGIAVVSVTASTVVTNVLPRRLSEQGTSRDEAARAVGALAQVTAGRAPDGASHPAIAASHLAFIDGMRAAFIVACAVAVVGSLVGLFLRGGSGRDDPSTGGDFPPAAVEPAGPPDRPADVHGQRRNEQRPHHQRVQ